VSIDALAERNDLLRGSGSFQAAMSALECLHAVGFEPKAMVTLTPVGLPDLPDLLCLLVEHGVKRISLNPLRPVGRGDKYRGWRPEPEELYAALHQAWQTLLPGQAGAVRLRVRARPRLSGWLVRECHAQRGCLPLSRSHRAGVPLWECETADSDRDLLTRKPAQPVAAD